MSASKPVSPNGLAIFTASQIQAREVHWIWDGYLPGGRVSMLQGDPGLGKSWLTLALATAISLGATLPGDDRERAPGRVMMLTAEDDLGDTVRPRLDTLGADLDRIELVRAKKEADKELPLSLIDDLPRIEHHLEARPYELMVVDPINAYLGTALDTHRDAAVRSVLAPLGALAERHGVAMLAVTHLTKGGRDRSIYRGQGSIAYVAAARVVLLLGADPDDEERRHLVCIKNNLAFKPPALQFVVAKGRGLEWAGLSSFTAEQLLTADSSDEKSAVSEAKETILDVLAGGDVPAKHAKALVMKQGVSQRTLDRAKAELQRSGRIQVKKEGWGREAKWVWHFCDEVPNQAELL